MKTCPHCKEGKSLEDFYVNVARKDGRGSVCKICQRLYLKNHYENNKAYYKKKARNHEKKMKEFIRQLKGNTPCVDCKIQYPYYVMDFDHKYDKQFSISSWPAPKHSNTSQLFEEIKKCDLVCSNCHRIRTFLRINPPTTNRLKD